MKKIFLRRLLPIILMAITLLFLDAPAEIQNKIIPGLNLNQKVNLGLDLQGGTQLDYKIDLRNVEEADKVSIIDGIKEIINKRVNGLGVSEPNIYTSEIADENHIIVELAGIKDIEEAKATVGKTIQLEFKERVEEIAEEEKAEIQTIAAEALEKIKGEETFTLVANEEVQAYPGKVDIHTSNDFIRESDIESNELRSTLSSLSNGDLTQNLVEGVDGMEVTSQGLQEKTGYFIVQKLDEQSEEVEVDRKREVTVRHLVVGYEGGQIPVDITRTKEAAKARAEEALSAIQNGQDFAEVARTYSDEPAASDTGGLLPEPVVEGSSYYDATFSEAALTLDTGEVSEVVESPFGFHVIKSEETIEANTGTETVTSYKYNSIFYSTVPDGWKETGLTGEHFVRADVVQDQFGNALVSIKFNDEGSRMFADITAANIGKPIAIFVGGQLISAPNVNGKIVGGEAQITGNFTFEEASTLARDLNTGAIPAPIILSGQYSIGASLGATALTQSINAALIGIALLIVFILAYYGLSGLIANIALVIYAITLIFLIKIKIPMTISFVIALAIYSALISKVINNDDSGSEKLISFLVASFVFFFLIFLLSSPVVLTLAGIAGVILSIGMAVDANVLIFERIKEEVNEGRDIAQAVEIGFERAWSSIRDSNYSSLITCAILLYFGTSIIKGFAINLAAGILVSMFTAITITRAFMDYAVTKEGMRKWLTKRLKRKKAPKVYEIVKNSKVWFAISGTLIGISLLSLAVFGLNFGIDFTGGTMMEIDFSNEVTKTQVEEAFTEIHDEMVAEAAEGEEVADIANPLVLPSGDSSFIVRTRDITNDEHTFIISELIERFGELTEPRFTVVGPVIGNVLKKKALYALLFAGAMIVLYIAFAFRKVPKEVSPWRFGLSAIVALTHDVIITLGVFVLLGQFLNVEIDALFITALLTIMGFSVHDTIVVFDRIRENLFRMKKNTEFDVVANTALNETLARSLNTSISTLFTIAALYLFGAESIKYFVFALLLGIIIGTYSSIFTATPVLCAWRKYAEEKKNK